MIGAIGQIARAVDDIERAKAWYAEVLGLPHLTRLASWRSSIAAGPG
jgi:catechol 2,3-dioxygenase-like lactoylglutathione lyase family enzyme